MFQLTAHVTTGPSMAFSAFEIGLDCQILASGACIPARQSKALTGSGCFQSSFCVCACLCPLLLLDTQLTQCWQDLPQQALWYCSHPCQTPPLLYHPTPLHSPRTPFLLAGFSFPNFHWDAAQDIIICLILKQQTVQQYPDRWEK